MKLSNVIKNAYGYFFEYFLESGSIVECVSKYYCPNSHIYYVKVIDLKYLRFSFINNMLYEIKVVNILDDLKEMDDEVYYLDETIKFFRNKGVNWWELLDMLNNLINSYYYTDIITGWLEYNKPKIINLYHKWYDNLEEY